MKRLVFLWVACCLALPAAKPLLLVSQKAGSSVGFYTWEGKHLTSVPVGTHPHEMTLSADGRYAYTTDNGTMRIEQAGAGGNSMSVIDLRERKRVAQISLGKYHRPHGIDVDPATGNVLITSENPDQLLIVDPRAQTVLRTYGTGGSTPHIVTVGHEGKWAYVSNARSATVAAIELATGKTITIAAGDRPEGSVLSKDGKTLYVANRVSNEVTIIDTVAKKRTGTIPVGGGPVRVGLSPDERFVIYALIGDNKVGFADIAARKQVAGRRDRPPPPASSRRCRRTPLCCRRSARKQVAVVDLDGPPVSLHTSPDGKYAFAASQEADTVYVVSIAERKLVRKFKTTAGAGPDPVLQIPVL